MNSCVIKDRKFRKLQERTGVDEKTLAVEIASSLDRKGRIPEIDEVFMSNSLPSMVKDFDMKEYSNGRYTIKSTVLGLESKNMQDEASSRINNEYKDYETRVIFNGENSIVVPTMRPINSSFINVDDIGKRADTSNMLNSMIAKVNNIYGMNIKTFNADNEHEMPFYDDPSYMGCKNALIYGGDIYINTDIASVDAPIHEMMHLILGEMKFNDPELYRSMVSQAKDFPIWEYMRGTNLYDMAMEDALEEVFVQEVSRYMSGLDSSISRMKLSEVSKLEYDITRMLDTLVFGVKSVRTEGFHRLANMSLLDLCDMMGSAISKMRDKGDMMGAAQNRILANMKSDLIKRGLLKEICD